MVLCCNNLDFFNFQHTFWYLHKKVIFLELRSNWKHMKHFCMKLLS